MKLDCKPTNVGFNYLTPVETRHAFLGDGALQSLSAQSCFAALAQVRRPSSASQTGKALPSVSLAPYKERHGCAIVMRSMTLPALQAVGRTACLYP